MGTKNCLTSLLLPITTRNVQRNRNEEGRPPCPPNQPENFMLGEPTERTAGFQVPFPSGSLRGSGCLKTTFSWVLRHLKLSSLIYVEAWFFKILYIERTMMTTSADFHLRVIVSSAAHLRFQEHVTLTCKFSLKLLFSTQKDVGFFIFHFRNNISPLIEPSLSHSFC